MKRGKFFGYLATTLVAVIATLGVWSHHAGAVSSDFSLQVSPSPLVATLKPGQNTDLELKIHNGGSSTENLKIAARGFTQDNANGKIVIDDASPTDVGGWVSFSKPTFTIASGQWITEKVHMAIPSQAGFSYSFALVISRQTNVLAPSGQSVNASVAVFTLINIDRPGAVKKLEIKNVTSSQNIYEYLPATFDIAIKNTGNTIVQPFGDVYIQRGDNDQHPITALGLNDMHGYILPGKTRTLTVSWVDGFPAYKTTTDANGNQKQDLAWNWSKLSNFRIGSYTAKVYAVYNDGQRDVPLEQNVTFWVLPWRLILGTLILIALIWYLIHLRIQHSTAKAVKRALASTKNKTTSHE